MLKDMWIKRDSKVCRLIGVCLFLAILVDELNQMKRCISSLMSSLPTLLNQYQSNGQGNWGSMGSNKEMHPHITVVLLAYILPIARATKRTIMSLDIILVP